MEKSRKRWTITKKKSVKTDLYITQSLELEAKNFKSTFKNVKECVGKYENICIYMG
jgi:hypothetical protein